MGLQVSLRNRKWSVAWNLLTGLHELEEGDKDVAGG